MSRPLTAFEQIPRPKTHSTKSNSFIQFERKSNQVPKTYTVYLMSEETPQMQCTRRPHTPFPLVSHGFPAFYLMGLHKRMVLVSHSPRFTRFTLPGILVDCRCQGSSIYFSQEASILLRIHLVDLYCNNLCEFESICFCKW